MEYIPLFFDLKDRSVLLVGGGEVALRKARLLTRAGAKVEVVARRRSRVVRTYWSLRWFC